MTKDQQALTLLSIATTLNAQLSEEGLLADTFGVNGNLSFHLDDALFAAIARHSKLPVEATYQGASLHARLTVGHVDFACCHNLL